MVDLGNGGHYRIKPAVHAYQLVVGRLSSLSMDIMASLSPSFWGNPMEFFDKELKAARLLDDFVSGMHEGLGMTKEAAPVLSCDSGRHP